MTYLKETHQKYPGHRSNISRTTIKYLQDTDQIYSGLVSNIS